MKCNYNNYKLLIIIITTGMIQGEKGVRTIFTEEYYSMYSNLI